MGAANRMMKGNKGPDFTNKGATELKGFIKEHYDAIADCYVDDYQKNVPDKPFVLEFLSKVTPGGKVLDVGCGGGDYTSVIKGERFEAVGIDLSTRMIELARQNHPETSYEVMDMTKLTFPDESFDGILVSWCFFHVPESDVESTLKGFARILKPGGTIYFSMQESPERKGFLVVDEPCNTYPTAKQRDRQLWLNVQEKTGFFGMLNKAGFQLLSFDLKAPGPGQHNFNKLRCFFSKK